MEVGVGSSSWWVGLGSVPYLCVMRFALRFLRPLARGNPARQQDCAFQIPTPKSSSLVRLVDRVTQGRFPICLCAA